jgi:hypothetical protein
MPKMLFGVSSQIAEPLSRDFFSPLNRWKKIKEYSFFAKNTNEIN